MKKVIIGIIIAIVILGCIGSCAPSYDTPNDTTNTSTTDTSTVEITETPTTNLADNVTITDVSIDSLGWVTATVYNGNDVEVYVRASCDDGYNYTEDYTYESVMPGRYEEITFFEEFNSNATVTIEAVGEDLYDVYDY